mmetsp:Transcript_122470/g.341332  ORF Transcript_122470/g.341332 Transcript_122470/m.341332 type:complete len:549 (-) Transcript_122470:96-1742(-)
MASPQAPTEMEMEGAAQMQDAEASVGVLGWLGFIIINFAAWGIVATASWIQWIFGFVVCLLYTGIIVGLAVWLRRHGDKYRQFVNLLWVIGATFVFILGVYISANVLGNLGENSDDGDFAGSFPKDPGSILSLLPDNASQELKMWADPNTNWAAERAPTFAAFGSSVFFNGLGWNATNNAQELWYTVGTTPAKVAPELMNARSFTEFNATLYFVASAGNEDGLWQIDPNNLGYATMMDSPSGDKSNFQARQLFVDQTTSKLYYKASYNVKCPNNCSASGQTSTTAWVETIICVDASSAGTTDLRADPCATVHYWCDDGSTSDKPPLASLWGILFLSAFPMIVLAGFVLVRLQLPGLVVNLFGGVACAVITLYLIARYDDEVLDGLPSFLKWFLTLYTSALWLALAAWSLLAEKTAPWLDELRTWAVAVVGVSFFVIIHIDLEIPYSGEAWQWVIYAFLALLQMVLSAVVSRTVPMVAGAIGTFVVAWKAAYEIVEFVDFGGSELKALAVLAIVALQGIGIIAAAIFYAGRREEIDGLVRRALTCGRAT